MKKEKLQDEWLLEKLRDRTLATEFLNAASEDVDPKTYSTALRQVVEARDGIAGVAKKPSFLKKTCAALYQPEVIPQLKY